MALTFGNRCGHVVDAPCLEIPNPMPVGPGGYPRVLTMAGDLVRSYYDNPELIPSLNIINETCRQRRSERREAIVRLLEAIIKFLDLATLTVGVRHVGQPLDNIPIILLAKHAGLDLRRTERALRDIGRAGLVTVVERRTLTSEGRYRSQPALKRVSPLLFTLLGLGLALELERTKARKRLERQQAQQPANNPPTAPEEQARRQLMRKALNQVVQQTFPQFRDVLAPLGRDYERQKRWNEVAIRIQQQHPEWSAQEVRAAADQALLS